MRSFSVAAFLASFFFVAISAEAGQFKVIKTFPASGEDGAHPVGNGAILGGKLYGFTRNGGAAGKGTLYRINLDGTGFQKLRDFTVSEGPPRSLVAASDRVLVACDGDANYGGNVYSYTPNDGLWTKLAGFASKPYSWFRAGHLSFVSGGFVYGTTNWENEIFRWDLAGSEPEILHTFEGGADGQYPVELLDGGGNVLYGRTERGGVLDKGTIFKLNKDGSNFQRLHSFGGEVPGYYNDGAARSMVLLNGKIYGVMRYGGVAAGSDSSPNGFLYSLTTDGSEYRVVKTLYRGDDVPHEPDCLATDGTSLFMGLDSGGFDLKSGGLISLKPDGTGQQTLIQFLWPNNSPNGQYPDGMIFSGNRLYGWNYEGGSGGLGTVWVYDTGASANPPPFTGPLYGTVTFGGLIHSVQTVPVSSKTAKGITLTINASKMVATKLSNAIVLDAARQAGLIASVSGYSIVCTDEDRKLTFYAYKPGASLAPLEEVLSFVESGVLQAPTITETYNSNLNTSKIAETGTEKSSAEGVFLGMDVAAARTLTYKSAEAVINGTLSTYYPGTSRGSFFGADEAGSRFVEGTFSIAAPKAIQVP